MENGPRMKEGQNARNIVYSVISLVVILLFIVVAIFQSVYFLNEDEFAVVTTFGKTEVVDETGMNFKVPFVQYKKVVSKAVKGFSVGYDLNTGESIPKESFMITNDYNFVNIDFYFEYQIVDPVKYIYSSEQPEVILKNLAQSYIRDTVGVHDIDTVLTTGKLEIQTTVEDLLRNRLEKEDIGIMLVNATIQDSEPPTEVASAFKAVEDAKQSMETAVNNAKADANTRIPEAEAKADKITKDANAYKQSRINEAEGQVQRFESLYAEYLNFPYITKQRMFFETIEDLLPNMKVYITDGSTQTLLPLEEFSSINVGNQTTTDSSSVTN